MPSAPASIAEIEHKLASSIDWNRARIKFLARFLVALITAKTVCLTQIASLFPGEAQTGSHYKRIQRFLRGFDVDYAALAGVLVTLLGVPPPWTLALDRTDWKLGKLHLNILMLALVQGGMAFPLFWVVLGKAGASTNAQRLNLLTRCVARFGAEAMGCVCADREFACIELLEWLVRQRIGFRLRLKSDVRVSNSRGQLVPVWRLFQNCSRRTERHLGRRMCLGQRVFVSGTRLADDYLIVISDRPVPLSEYALRWGIETLFGALKRRGFCLEATHVSAPARLERLLGLLALAFAWAYAAGAGECARRCVPLKKHGRAARSVFRVGLDRLRRVLCPLAGQYRPPDFQAALQFLSCT